MIELSTIPKELDHWVRLNESFRSDLHWWAVFLDDWNGVSMLDSVVHKTPSATLTSDASGRWGCGFQFRWPPAWEAIHITVKELLPIVVACAVWGHQWRGCTILCRCDNAAVVAILKSGSSKDRVAMHLMRCLFFFTAHYPDAINASAPARERQHCCGSPVTRCSLLLYAGGPHRSASTNRVAGRTNASASDTETRLDVSRLESRTLFYFAHGLASSTQRTYKSGENRYLNFAISVVIAPFPYVNQYYVNL